METGKSTKKITILIFIPYFCDIHNKKTKKTNEANITSNLNLYLLPAGSNCHNKRGSKRCPQVDEESPKSRVHLNHLR